MPMCLLKGPCPIIAAVRARNTDMSYVGIQYRESFPGLPTCCYVMVCAVQVQHPSVTGVCHEMTHSLHVKSNITFEQCYDYSISNCNKNGAKLFRSQFSLN